MSHEHPIDRRVFLKTLAAASAGAALAPPAALATENAPPPDGQTGATLKTRMPSRPFGKTGVELPILTFGAMFNVGAAPFLFKQALEWGLTCWDTADCYNFSGFSEDAIGRYFEKNPAARDQVFLITKCDEREPRGMDRLLRRSLDRMHRTQIDLYLIHGASDFDEMSPAVFDWAARAKQEGRIRFFGFSTHKNMEECLFRAARADGGDGIMFTCNYRLLQSDRMQAAIQACADKGIGLIAMKTQGGGQVQTGSPAELKLAGRFVEAGFTDAQAKLKAVWEDTRITTITSLCKTTTILTANVAAALGRKTLAQADRELFRQAAQETCSGYCAGCARICEEATAGRPPISDAMRHLMYYHSYGDPDLARREFAALPAAARALLAGADYTAAEARCPQRMPIARLMREAIERLG